MQRPEQYNKMNIINNHPDERFQNLPGAHPRKSGASSGWFEDDNYKPQTFAERWELDPETQDGIFRIKAYQPVYLLARVRRTCTPRPSSSSA
jgi:hypothetical protein